MTQYRIGAYFIQLKIFYNYFFINCNNLSYGFSIIQFYYRPTGYGEKCISYANVSEAFHEACRGVLGIEPGTNDLTDIQLDNFGDVIQETTRILCEWLVCLISY